MSFLGEYSSPLFKIEVEIFKVNCYFIVLELSLCILLGSCQFQILFVFLFLFIFLLSQENDIAILAVCSNIGSNPIYLV